MKEKQEDNNLAVLIASIGVIGTIFAAFFTFLGTVINSAVERSSITDLERQKYEYSLITDILADERKEKEEIAKDLLFLIEIEAIKILNTEKIREHSESPGDLPRLPNPMSNQFNTPTGAIIFSKTEGIINVCVSILDYNLQSNPIFHAWVDNGSANDIPMSDTESPSCMYQAELPANSEGGVLRVNGQWVSVRNFVTIAEDGCQEVVTINSGIIKASTSPNSSLLETRDSINGNSGKWGWACK